MFTVTILGNNSAVPAYERHPTSQVLSTDSNLYLIDCGEGTQMQLKKYAIKKSRINYIFISHLHGDHYFGLIGLITSFGLIGRTNDLYIYGTKQLEAIMQIQLNVAKIVLPYKLHFIEINKSGIILENNKIKVTAFATNHRIECYGFKFEEIKNPRKINLEKCKEYEIPSAYYTQLQLGYDYEQKNGNIIKNELVTEANIFGKTYAFSADTKYDENIIPFIKNADLLYHETTYLMDVSEKAIDRFHSTTIQAATIAKKATVKKLLIGHFSSKYKDLAPFLMETKSVFENTELASEGTIFEV